MSLSEFVDQVTEGEKTLTVFTAAEDEQLFAELERFFDTQNVTVRRGSVDADGPQNFVVLHQADDAVAVSTLEDVRDSLFLGGGSPRYPGDVSLSSGETPDVINSLGNTTFAADGADGTLLTQITHYVLDLAFESGGGVVHAGIQQLSNLEGAAGHDVYAKLAAEGVDVRVYGTADVEVDAGYDVHAANGGELADTRFVVFDGGGEDARKAALVAVDPESDGYRGFWTFEADLVDDIADYLERTYGV